ncbi:MAG: quinoprotein dehydrogenase-associated putative ABC transporter substrate-binding protein [Inquilinus sp.]|nr:quinoprotein dehydrogenase-associated putative ABC transporter substrate-binding protein [Inquilinus sp.]
MANELPSKKWPAVGVGGVWLAGFLLVVAGLAGGAVAQEVSTRTELRVCADPNLPPYSTEALDGFENRLAEMIADELGIPVVYTWWPQTIGFVRNTLAARRCDLVMGTASGEELMQNTNAYYRSTYAMVYRADQDVQPETLADPYWLGKRIGVVAQTPPANLLSFYGLSNIEPYQLNIDTRADQPARRAVEDVASGATDMALIWGPIAGYFAKRQDVPLVVVPLLSDPGPARLQYRITMGIRGDEPDWRHWLNGFIRDHQDEINRLLASYEVPLLDRAGNLIVVDTAAAP